MLLPLTESHDVQAYWGSRDIGLRILQLETRRESVVSFTPRPLCPQGKSPWYWLQWRESGEASPYR